MPLAHQETTPPVDEVTVPIRACDVLFIYCVCREEGQAVFVCLSPAQSVYIYGRERRKSQLTITKSRFTGVLLVRAPLGLLRVTHTLGSKLKASHMSWPHVLSSLIGQAGYSAAWAPLSNTCPHYM